MASRLRRVFKFAGWSLGTVFVLLAAFMALLAWPGLLFAHQLEYRNFLVDDNGDHWHTTYYLARVMVEYSLDARGMSFAQLAEPGVREDVVLRDLLADYAAGKF